MMLAYAEREYPFQLRADLQETYNLNLDRMGEDYTYLHAAILVSQLPSTSRLVRAIYPDAEWTQDTWLLASMEYGIRTLIWQQTKDGYKGVNAPKPPKTPSEREFERHRLDDFDKDFIIKVLGEANNG